jgi:predicted ATPase
MRFIVASFPPRDNPQPNTCYLVEDNWDDFSFKTSFVLHYSDGQGELTNIGIIKIMKKGQASGPVELPSRDFEFLDESYCSLGNTQSYYEEMYNILEPARNQILKSLRDCVLDSNIYNEFKTEQAMQSSLLRDVSNRNVEISFKNILKGDAESTPFYFRFQLKTAENYKIDVKVTPESNPPTNVHVLIGRNGAGKTRILSGIADALTGNDETGSTISLAGEIIFLREDDYSINIPGDDIFLNVDEDERFANLVTIVFSVFDRFAPIKPENVVGKIRYQYVGLKKYAEREQAADPHHFKTPNELQGEFQTSLETCLSTLRKTRWQEAVRILNSDPIFGEYKLDELVDGHNSIAKLVDIFQELSSGHKIILLSITKLVELVDERTLVLIDEPETHLHPPLLASFTRALSNLLIKRNGVAMIATHSPVILQEVPKSCVTIIHRVGSEYRFLRPELETFGENVGTLTREVFKLEVIESGFHKMIKEYLEGGTYESLLDDFGDQIGSEGRAIARSILALRENKND